MININTIIHIENEIFDIEKDEAVLCIQNYIKDINGFEFTKDNIYSIAFANEQGAMMNKFSLKCTKQKHHFKMIDKQNVEIPLVSIQDLQPQENSTEEIQETQYRFETSGYKQKDGSAFRKNSIYSETQIKDAGLHIEELFAKEAITWLK